MAESSGAHRKRKRGPERRIFLSHSGKQKPFVEQLFEDLKRVQQDAFFDKDSDSLPKAERFAPNILEAAEQCQMGVVVLSEDYLTSRWPMLELSKFVESMKTNNPALRLFPIFFKLSPDELKEDKVESRWKPAWRNIVRKDGTEEEVVTSWSEAVKALRDSNGLNYADFANSEYKYRTAILKEICKELRPILRWKTDYIQGRERLCEEASSMFKDYESRKYLGLYGMAGVGKSTLCKAMCSYCQGEFGADVYYVALGNDKADDRLARLKGVLQQMLVDSSTLSSLGTEEQGWQHLEELLAGRPIFLAIDNVGASDDSKKEASSYLRALGCESKVLVTSTCKEILEDVIWWKDEDHPGYVECCKPIPRLNHDEAADLFLSKVKAISRLKKSNIIERCLRECQFVEKGWDTPQYHPLILRATGLYVCDAHSAGINLEEALESKSKLKRRGVYESLGKNYRPLSDEMKLVFLDTVFFLSNGYAPAPWWTLSKKIAYNDVWVSWIREVHGTTIEDAKMNLNNLHKLALIEVSTSENFSSATRVVKNEVIWSGEKSFESKEVQSVEDYCCFKRPYAHDLYKEFARDLVEKEESMEWEWWMSREELVTSDKINLKRVILKENKSVIGRAPKILQAWCNLEFLMLSACTKFGRGDVLELGGLNKLRALVVDNCATLKRIICSCNHDYSNQNLAYEGERQHCQGCMAELCSVKLQLLNSLEDISFLRHCPKIQILRIVSCNGTIVPTTSEYSENPKSVILSHLKELHTLIVWEDLHKVDLHKVDTFIKWLCNTLQLQKLTTLEYWVLDRPANVLQRAKKVNWDMEIAGVNTIHLNRGDETSSKLLVLSLYLPNQIWEAQWSHLSSELRKLNLCSCEGSSRWPDLQELRAWVIFSPCQFFMN